MTRDEIEKKMDELTASMSRHITRTIVEELYKLASELEKLDKLESSEGRGVDSD